MPSSVGPGHLSVLSIARKPSSFRGDTKMRSGIVSPISAGLSLSTLETQFSTAIPRTTATGAGSFSLST